MTTSWTQTSKPSTSWTTSTSAAKRMYDDSNITYDSSNFYDGSTTSFTQVSKPSTSWTTVPKAT